MPYMYVQIAKIITFFRKIYVEQHDGDVRFGPEVEMWLFCTCPMKKMQKDNLLTDY